MKFGNAVRYDEYGDFDVVQVVAVPQPTPPNGQVVVRVAAAGLNHIERFVREGRFQDEVTTRFPTGQGVDFAGVIIAVGSDVRTFRKGQEVLGHLAGAGSHATWVSVADTAIIPKPHHIPMEVAGGLYLAGCTALHTVNGLRLGPSDTVVITAAAGGVGHLQAQLAGLTGAKVIAVGSIENHDFLRALHTLPVEYGEGVEKRLREAAGKDPITAFIDNHGDYESVAEQLGVPAARVVTSPQRRDIELRYLTAAADDQAALQDLTSITALVDERRITVVVSGFYPFEFVTQAYEDLARMHSRGKVVIGMDAVESGPRRGWYLTEKARAQRARLNTSKAPAELSPRLEIES